MRSLAIAIFGCLVCWCAPLFDSAAQDVTQISPGQTFTDLGPGMAHEVVAGIDGGFVVGGVTAVERNERISLKPWAMRFDRRGNRLWVTHLSPRVIASAWQIDMRTLPGPMIMLSGADRRTIRYGSDARIWASYLAPDGEVVRQWQVRRFSREYIADLVAYPDGGVAVAGWSDIPRVGYPPHQGADYITHGRITRIDRYGNTVWDRQYGMNEYDFIFSAVVRPDGGLYIAGRSQEGVSDIVWVARLNAGGDVYVKARHSPKEHDLNVHALASWRDGDVVAAVYRFNKGEGRDELRLLRLDPMWLQARWDRTYPTLNFSADALVTLRGGGLAVAGQPTNSGCKGSRIFGFDRDGNVVWSRRFDTGKRREVTDLLELPSGELIAVGGDCVSSAPWMSRLKVPDPNTR